MMDLSHEFIKIDSDLNLDEESRVKARLAVQEVDAQRKERAHNLRQLLRGHLLMERDVDYMVNEGKVVIVDENTGRPQPGRRFADGLHQAIEAKEERSYSAGNTNLCDGDPSKLFPSLRKDLWNDRYGDDRSRGI